jgi:uncharacterized protein (TIGR02145 family)
VSAPGTFAAKPEDAGMLYQWNRKKGWPATGREVTGWDKSRPAGDAWTKANDPSPAGWRTPTFDEMKKLLDEDKVSRIWTTQNGVNGYKFTDKATGNSIFLPAAGCRDNSAAAGYSNNSDGTLYEAGTNGYYWSSTEYGGDGGYRLRFNSRGAGWNDGEGFRAYNVRPAAE